MTRWAVVDAGPIVALLDRREQHHSWATEQVKMLTPPMLVCEPVLVEAAFLLARVPNARDALFSLVAEGVLEIAFHLNEHINEVSELLRKYQDRPMSLADACLVRMAEMHDSHYVFTLDSDFKVYRKHGRMPLDLICPID